MLKQNIEVKKFSTHPGDFIQKPFLAEIQFESWDWFVKKGIKELFKEISPIRDYTGKEYELYFEDYFFDEPKFSEEESWQRGSTFEAALRARARLVNLKTKKEIVQEVYLGDYPIMTQRGTFIINGVERVVVSQFIRSAGVYFTAKAIKGKKFFGAKVIPDRGSWLEFETDIDGSIGVKIDKHRKVPVTDLLRIFGLETNDEILKTFADIDAEGKHIQATLKKDAASDVLSSYLEIYKRLRPGDLASPENAKNLIDGMFKRPDRFSLSEVGRYKMNQRLGIEEKVDTQLIRLEDLILIVREIIRLNNDDRAEPDDIDSLSNRRVRSVGELLQSRMRVGFARMRRIIQDRMSTLEVEQVSPVVLINPKPLSSPVRDFLVSSQLSQFMDQVNPLSELSHKRRLSAMGPGGLTRERAGFEVRDVHESHYGRICPIETPEGQNIGLINHLATFAKVNKYGFLETPYAKVKNGKVTDEIVWMDASQEKKYKIAEGGVALDKNRKIINEIVEARVNGEPGVCHRDEVEFIDVSPTQVVSASTALIPFLEHDDANRALMGANMQRQAVPSVKPEAPLVGTGIEEKIARDSGRLIIAPEDGEIVEADASHIVLKTKSGEKKEFKLSKFRRSNQYIGINQKTIVVPGQKVKKGDVLADGPATDNGVLALGQNLLVAFIPFFGGNYDDSIAISERVAQQDRFTSIYIEDFYCDVRDTKLGPEVTTSDIPNVSEEKLRNLDEEGIIRIGAEVRAGDILVGKISPKGETDLTAEEKLLRSIFGEKARDVKDSSLYLPHGKSGRVIGIKIFSREKGDKLEPGIIKRIQVEVAQLRKIRAGDKLAGRHGNKGVISRVYPVEDMPYLEDGTPVDIVLNPLGVASRMNLGQILETHLGLAAKKLNYRAIIEVFVGASEEEISKELKAAGYPENGKMVVYDGRTGKRFDQDVMVGYIYMLKLNHLVEDKIHMRSIGPYSLVTQQPLGGKAQFGGQRFGEMEVWALEGYGSAYTLQEMLTIKSDDVLGRAAAFESIVKGEELKMSTSPSAFNVLTNEINALGLKIEPLKKEDLPEENL
jgi:DNA-directed RNA polymerase subunit beta